MLRSLIVAAAPPAGASPAFAPGNDHSLGAGVELGDPAGFTIKYFRNNDEALQFGFGLRARYNDHYWRYQDDYSPMFTGDWVYHFNSFGPRNRRIWFRIGVGMGAGVGYVSSCVRDWW